MESNPKNDEIAAGNNMESVAAVFPTSKLEISQAVPPDSLKTNNDKAAADGGLEDIAVSPQEGSSSPTTSNPQVSSIPMPKVKTGILGASSNLVNAIVGAGIIGIPYAIRESGFIVGIILLILVAYFTDKSLRMIVELASFNPKLKDLGVLTYEDLMSIPFGKWGSRFILISMFIFAYGAMVVYLLIVKDSVPTVLGLGQSFVEREVVMIVTSLLIMVPLSMLRDISRLAFTSSLSVLADLVLVIIVAIFAPIKESVSDAGGFGQVLKDNWRNGRLFIGLGVLSTTFACQHSAFLISGSLKNKTAGRWAQVVHLSLFIAAVLSMTLGVTGYLGFLDETRGNVLNNFDPNSPILNAVRALLAVTMVFTYPMESFVARHVLMQLLFDGNMDNTSIGPDGQQIPENKFLGCFGRRERWTFYIYLMTLVPALIFDDLGPVLSLTGSLGASFIAYVGPGLVYLGVNGSDFLAWTGKALQNREYKHNKSDSPGDVELPVVGDSSASMQTAPEATYPEGHKPWWWWLLGMPLWVAIASNGARGTKTFLADLTGDQAESPSSQDDDEVVLPRKRDFCFAIVFIIFGVIAAVLGVLTNIYVQINGIFFSP